MRHTEHDDDHWVRVRESVIDDGEARIKELEAALKRIAAKPDEILRIMHEHDIVISDHSEPMRKFAFTIYTTLVTAAEIAREALQES